MIALAMMMLANTAADWTPVQGDTAIPAMLFICRFEGEKRPNFNGAWWQLQLVRNPKMDRVRLYKLNDEANPEAVFLENSLKAYDRQSDGTRKSWRVSYSKGSDALEVVISSPASADGVVNFSWSNTKGVRKGFCDPAPAPPEGWELKPEVWK